MDKASLLQQLHDIHLPQPISFWPLAPGWYVLAAIIAIVALLMSFGIYYFYRSFKRRRKVLFELRRLQENATNKISAEIVAELSSLLKRVAMFRYPSEFIAGISGKEWLDFLNGKTKNNDFSYEEGMLLVTVAYQPAKDVDLEKLFIIVRCWIKRNL